MPASASADDPPKRAHISCVPLPTPVQSIHLSLPTSEVRHSVCIISPVVNGYFTFKSSAEDFQLAHHTDQPHEILSSHNSGYALPQELRWRNASIESGLMCCPYCQISNKNYTKSVEQIKRETPSRMLALASSTDRFFLTKTRINRFGIVLI